MNPIVVALFLLAPASASPPPACEAPEYRQFDFWVGSWDVYRTDTEKLVAHSLIEKLYAGCAVRENWMPIGAPGGGSLNSWRPEQKRWRQTWTDGANSWNEYTGGIENGLMVLTGSSSMPGSARTAVRMTYEAKPDGSVVQTGYQSSDGGKTWSVRYQFAYRPAAPAAK